LVPPFCAGLDADTSFIFFLTEICCKAILTFSLPSEDGVGFAFIRVEAGFLLLVLRFFSREGRMSSMVDDNQSRFLASRRKLSPHVDFRITPSHSTKPEAEPGCFFLWVTLLLFSIVSRHLRGRGPFVPPLFPSPPLHGEESRPMLFALSRGPFSLIAFFPFAARTFSLHLSPLRARKGLSFFVGKYASLSFSLYPSPDNEISPLLSPPPLPFSGPNCSFSKWETALSFRRHVLSIFLLSKRAIGSHLPGF